jgi:hypothetical protein
VNDITFSRLYVTGLSAKQERHGAASVLRRFVAGFLLLRITWKTVRSSGVQIGSKGPVVKTSEQINGNTAKVTITQKNGDTSTVSLVKIDDKWKIADFDKLW